MTSLFDFIVSTIIPRLASLWQKDQEVAVAVAASTTAGEITQPVSTEQDNQLEVVNELFIRAHGLESMSFTTAWRWMRLIGFRYDSRRQSFYIDGHEREDIVANQTKFCKS
jgi:hypothetical protein